MSRMQYKEKDLVFNGIIIGGALGGGYVGYHTLSALFGVNAFSEPPQTDGEKIKQMVGRTVVFVGTPISAIAGFIISLQGAELLGY